MTAQQPPYFPPHMPPQGTALPVSQAAAHIPPVQYHAATTAAQIPPTAPALTGWKYSASDASALIGDLQRLRAEIEQEYPIRDIVVLGMGGSALGARVFADLYHFELSQLGVRLRIVDMTEPSTIQAILNDFNAAGGLVIVSSKSGSTLEPLCLGHIFFQHLSLSLGSTSAAAAHFISISDESTALSNLAAREAWRGIINTPKNVGGRFSALTAFGLAPLVLAGIDPIETIQAAQNMQLTCMQSESNPAQSLAHLIYQNLTMGRNKLIISHDTQSESFARWLEQLIAESLGKEGKGIIPLPMPTHRANRLLALRHPDVQNIVLENLSKSRIGQDLVRWMFAIEKIAAHLQVDPFDQPNVEAVKQATRLAIQENGAGLQESFGQDRLHHLLADPRIKNRSQLPALIGSNNFIVILSWTPTSAERTAYLENLAANLEDRYLRPVVIAEGPHYLHASGQLYKGGPNLGIYLLLIEDPTVDMPIPKVHYSLRQLYRAELSGDLEVMLSLGKPIVRL